MKSRLGEEVNNPVSLFIDVTSRRIFDLASGVGGGLTVTDEMVEL